MGSSLEEWRSSGIRDSVPVSHKLQTMTRERGRTSQGSDRRFSWLQLPSIGQYQASFGLSQSTLSQRSRAYSNGDTRQKARF